MNELLYNRKSAVSRNITSRIRGRSLVKSNGEYATPLTFVAASATSSLNDLKPRTLKKKSGLRISLASKNCTLSCGLPSAYVSGPLAEGRVVVIRFSLSVRREQADVEQREKESRGGDGERHAGGNLSDRVRAQIDSRPANHRNQHHKRQRLAAIEQRQRSERGGYPQRVRTDFPIARDVLHDQRRGEITEHRRDHQARCVREPERDRSQRVEDDERRKDHLSLHARRHLQIRDAIRGVQPEDVEHRADRRKERRKEEQAPKIEGVLGADMGQNDEERERRQKGVEDRRKTARQIAPNAPVLDRHDGLERFSQSPRIGHAGRLRLLPLEYFVAPGLQARKARRS